MFFGINKEKKKINFLPTKKEKLNSFRSIKNKTWLNKNQSHFSSEKNEKFQKSMKAMMSKR